MPFQNDILAGSAGQGGGYEIDNSLRDDDISNLPYGEKYLHREISSSTTSSNFTFSCWFKAGGDFSSDSSSVRPFRTLYSSGNSDANCNIGLSDQTINGGKPCIFYGIVDSGGGTGMKGMSNALIRDYSAWYHLVISYDQSLSASSRVKGYLNGELLTWYSQQNPTGNMRWVFDELFIGTGQSAETVQAPWNGYMAETHMLDGITKHAIDFGETSATTGQWVPIEYTGSYGTDGFYQKYGDSENPYDIVDISSNTWTLVNPNNSTVKTTSQYKVGDSSLFFNGSAYIKKDNNQITNGWNGSNTDGYTIEMWVRPESGDNGVLVANYFNSINYFHITLNNNNTVSLYWKNSNAAQTNTGIYSYTSSGTLADDTWTHMAFSWVGDGSNPSTDNILRFYINGVQDGTALGSGVQGGTGGKVPWAMWGSENSGNQPLFFGASHLAATMGSSYLDQIRFSNTQRYPDGTSFSPPTTAFVSDSDTGLLIQPIFTGGLGKDSSGNGNDFDIVGLTVNDQMIDTPTNNFCTLNPLVKPNATITLSEGNLQANRAANGWNLSVASMGVASGKWYWECLLVLTSGNMGVGLVSSNAYKVWNSQDSPQNEDGALYYANDGEILMNNTYISPKYGTSYTTGDLIGIALNMDAATPTITFYKNNSSQGTQNLAGKFLTASHNVPDVALYGTGEWKANFGQDSSFAGSKTSQGNQDSNDIGDFYYTPPTGYLALCTNNLPTPEISLPGEHFNTILYDDGAGAKTGVGFQPDVVWVKSRGSAKPHKLTDAVRGVTKALVVDTNAAETTDSTGLTAFGADGFTVGADTDYSDTTGTGMVAWNWKAGGATTVTNTDGYIESEVSANTAAGFSIVTYTGNGGVGPTPHVGHGLSQAPEFIVAKNLDTVVHWPVYNKLLGATKAIFLSNPDGPVTSSNYWADVTPTASVFTAGYTDDTNGSGDDMIAYCFHSVESYSSVQLYKGNADNDGTFVYLGFRPAFLMLREYSTSDQWGIYDDKRPGYNQSESVLYPDSNVVEETVSTRAIDLLSNGFKLRTSDGTFNPDGHMLCLAFAESPFKTSNAR